MVLAFPGPCDLGEMDVYAQLLFVLKLFIFGFGLLVALALKLLEEALYIIYGFPNYMPNFHLRPISE